MKKKLFSVLAVVAIAAVAGYNVYSAKSEVKLSDLALANVEALAGGEFPSSICDPSWEQECCVCSHIHNTYARASSSLCETRTGCSHY